MEFSFDRRYVNVCEEEFQTKDVRELSACEFKSLIDKFNGMVHRKEVGGCKICSDWGRLDNRQTCGHLYCVKQANERELIALLNEMAAEEAVA